MYTPCQTLPPNSAPLEEAPPAVVPISPAPAVDAAPPKSRHQPLTSLCQPVCLSPQTTCSSVDCSAVVIGTVAVVHTEHFGHLGRGNTDWNTPLRIFGHSKDWKSLIAVSTATIRLHRCSTVRTERQSAESEVWCRLPLSSSSKALSLKQAPS